MEGAAAVAVGGAVPAGVRTTAATEVQQDGANHGEVQNWGERIYFVSFGFNYPSCGILLL